METITLDVYNPLENYSEEEIEKLLNINLYTKTRRDHRKNDAREHYGIEQSFLVYSVAKKYNCKNMLEIGTGRGTASYSVSMLKNVEKVDTFDVIGYDEKVLTAVKFRSFYGSNKDIYEMIPYSEKSKINFNCISILNNEYIKKNEGKFDMAFIDGNHSNYSIIMDDFVRCEKLTKEDGIILFDDYGNFPVVTQVIEDVMKSRKDYKFILVPFRGYYFSNWSKREKEKGSGVVLCFKQKEKL